MSPPHDNPFRTVGIRIPQRNPDGSATGTRVGMEGGATPTSYYNGSRRYFTMRTILSAIVLGMLASVAICQETPHRLVQVTITLKDSANVPLSALPISCSTRMKESYAITAADGRATLLLTVQSDEQAVFLAVSPANAVDTDEQARAMARVTQIAETCVIPRTVVVMLAGEVDVYERQLVLSPARRVKLRRVDSEGAPIPGYLVMPENSVWPAFHRDGVHEATGVPAAATILFAADLKSGMLTPIVVPASAENIDMGDVVAELPAANATLQITFAHRGGLDPRLLDGRLRAFLISTDGQTLLDLFLQDGKTVRQFGGQEPSPVPSGEYWVCPTSLVAGLTADTLLTVVRAGIDLSASGIPRVVVPAGGEVELTVDAAAAQRAILVAGGVFSASAGAGS